MTGVSKFYKADRMIQRAILAGSLCMVIGLSVGVIARMLWDYSRVQKSIAAEVAGQEYRAEHDLDAKRRVEKMKFQTRVR